MKRLKYCMRDESGWFMMDAVALCFILMAMAGALVLFRTEMGMRQSALARSAAVHVAETQCACLEEQAYTGNLPDGDMGWRGRQEDLTQHGTSFDVITSVIPMETPMKRVTITVTWNLGGKEESFQLERRIREHG